MTGPQETQEEVGGDVFAGEYPSGNEQLISGFAHWISIVPLLGPGVAGLVWLAYREGSKFVAGHCRQAAVFQLMVLAALLAVAIVGWILSLAPALGGILWFFGRMLLVVVWIGGAWMSVRAGMQAYRGERVMLPLAGEWESDQA